MPYLQVKLINPTMMTDSSVSPIGFNFNPLNRRSERRDDHAFIEQLRQDEAARFLIFHDEIPLLKRSNGHDVWFRRDEAESFGEAVQCVFLGQENDGSGRFAVGVALNLESGEVHVQGEPCERIDVRSIATQGLVTLPTLGMIGEAKSMLDWHRRHGFCANCGHASRSISSGWQRMCDACGTRHFPRVDPVVIMLTVDGERCLLGRQRQFAPGMYSALAGFVEPGETVEDAVRREVLEEAGLKCAEVVYFASQPWPFPSSMMIGCFARASDTEIVVDHTELEDARWFSRAEVAAMLDGTHASGLSAPKPFAIAHHLLKAFAERGEAVLRG
jgi:NAD+ diphosphatase